MALAAALGVVGCANIPMPPPVLPFDGVAREATGTTGVRVNGGMLASSVAAGGGGLEVDHQFTPEWEGDVNGIALQGPGGTFAAGRVGVRYTFLNEHLAWTGGIGAQGADGVTLNEASSGGKESLIVPYRGASITADTGLRAGWVFRGFIEPSIGLTVSGGAPVLGGGGASLWLMASVGVNFRVADRWRLGAAVLYPFYGYDATTGNETLLLVFGAVSVGYQFGPASL
jgi:hypothetical protein